MGGFANFAARLDPRSDLLLPDTVSVEVSVASCRFLWGVTADFDNDACEVALESVRLDTVAAPLVATFSN